MRNEAKYRILAWNKIYSMFRNRIYSTDALGCGLWCYDLLEHTATQIAGKYEFSLAGLKCPELKLRAFVKKWEEAERKCLKD